MAKRTSLRRPYIYYRGQKGFIVQPVESLERQKKFFNEKIKNK